MLRARSAFLAVALLLLAWSSARADLITVSFPSSSSTVVNSGINDSSMIGYFWSASRGDSVQETFTGTGLTWITHLDLNFSVAANVLNPGNAVEWDVLVNGTKVGTWTHSAADGTGAISLSYNFADIVGNGTYT